MGLFIDMASDLTSESLGLAKLEKQTPQFVAVSKQTAS